METHFTHNLYDRRPIPKSKVPAVKWFKEWVPQDVVATGGKCMVLKWINEATRKAMKHKSKEQPEVLEPEPEPTTEVLFLCSYGGCGKTFIDAGALRKHSHIHGERQYVCHYENCGKKFLDSSKLKRHILVHTGERDFVCPYEGCGKAFSLDFNLRSHMKTHSQENYHLCPYPECGKRYAHEYKLKNHVSSQHEKGGTSIEVTPKYTPPVEKPVRTPKYSATSTGPSSDRPFGCPYDGCEKAYIHEYKLNLHLRREHPGHFPDENAKNNTQHNNNNNGNDMDEGSEQEATYTKRGNSRAQKQSRAKPSVKMPPAKKSKISVAPAPVLNVVKKPWPIKDEMFEEEDSEETEEERDDVGEGGWRYGGGGDNNDDDDDDEETEDED